MLVTTRNYMLKTEFSLFATFLLFVTLLAFDVGGAPSIVLASFAPALIWAVVFMVRVQR